MKIILNNLVKSYKERKVVKRISLEVNKGEIVGLLGPNGAGKTTTFYMIIGLIKPEAGKIFLDNEDITRLPMHKRANKGIGYLAQEASIFRRLTVEENILLILEMRGVPEAERGKKILPLLEEFGLINLRHQMAYTLSGGERRRVEIARALACNPDFILLDEPFTGIDPIAVVEIQKIIYNLKEKGLGILITDHNVKETLAITDKAYIIRNGEILVSGESSDIAKNSIAKKYYLGENFILN
ncbi:MAG: LPS export ABC transporter ATP-binding protein [Armatimonadetes bacterium]|nr:LPS export ABC transporter ATP-binding protein [Armatimonadota bacterium]